MRSDKNIKLVLVILRVAIGGHLFFSGLVKLMDADWTARSFLEGSYGVFQWLASSDLLIQMIDQLNIWILILAGVALILGLVERIAATAGAALLGLYYIAYIPLDPATSDVGYGPTFLVNMLLVEVLALVVLLMMPTGQHVGLGRWLVGSRPDPEVSPSGNNDRGPGRNTRRSLLKSLATVPLLAVFSFPLFSRKTARAVDAISGATALGRTDVFWIEYERLKKLDLDTDEGVTGSRETLPYGSIGNMKISRLIGGNRIISHDYCARDLRYVSKLAKIYNTEERILMTLKSIESQGINTMFLTFRNFQDYKLLDYWKDWGGGLQWISEIQSSDLKRFSEIIERNLMIGASALCLSREACDRWVAEGAKDELPKALEIAKKFDVPVGIGGHYNETFRFVIEEKLQPDFFFKSYHKDSYWSAHPEVNRTYMEVYGETTEQHGNFHDNLWCRHPAEFTAMMKEVDIPWIAFKTNAAGALPYQEGFEFALKGGADFICCSMYDFEIGDSIRSLNRAIMNL